MKKFKIIIQARIGSSRLKRKMTLPFYEKNSLLETVIENLLFDFNAEDIVVATSNLPENNIIGEYCKKYNIDVFYGSENDVLSRFTEISKREKLDFLIRVCADNVFIQNNYIKDLIENYRGEDYISYFFSDGTPAIKTHSGFFTELVKCESLFKVKNLTKENLYREHVTNFIYEHEKMFNIKKLRIENEDIIRKIRLTIDDEVDFNLTKNIYERYRKSKVRKVEELITLNEKDKMLNQINKNTK